MKRMLCAFAAALLAALSLGAAAQEKKKTDPVEWYTDFRSMAWVLGLKEGEVVAENQYYEEGKRWILMAQKFDGFSVILSGDAQDNLRMATIASSPLDDAELAAGKTHDKAFYEACVCTALSSYGPFGEETLTGCRETMARAVNLCLAKEEEYTCTFAWEGFPFEMTYWPDQHLWLLNTVTGT